MTWSNEQSGRAPSEIEGQVNRLAEQEARLAGADFEDRCMARIEKEVLSQYPESLPIDRHTAEPERRNTIATRLFAMAASIAVIGGTMFIVWMNRPVSQPMLAQEDAQSEVEDFIETVAWLDEVLPQAGSSEELEDSVTVDELESLFDDVRQTLLGNEESM